MCKVIAITNQKGGIGKTTTVHSLGTGLVAQGKKVLLIDLDPQANLTMCCGLQEPDKLDYTVLDVIDAVVNDEPVNEKVIVHTNFGVDLIPSNIGLSGAEISIAGVMSREVIVRSFIEEIRGSYDYILIDTMPSLGILTVNALACADSVLIPVQPAYLPAKGLQQLLRTVSMVRKRLNPSLKIESFCSRWWTPERGTPGTSWTRSRNCTGRRSRSSCPESRCRSEQARCRSPR